MLGSALARWPKEEGQETRSPDADTGSSGYSAAALGPLSKCRRPTGFSCYDTATQLILQ